MQTHRQSIIEVSTNLLVSLVLAYYMNLTLVPFCVARYTGSQTAIIMTVAFSAMSFVRQYLVRRFFNWFHHKPTMITVAPAPTT